MLIINSECVHQHLTYADCISAMRHAMIDFSAGKTKQHLRSILQLGEGAAFGIMPGALSAGGVFGAKLVSVFPGNFELGKSSHQGVVVLFESQAGAPVCIVDAGAITAIRTAAASAAATDTLSLPNASRMALLGYGEQALTHAKAILEVRPLEQIRVWGRSFERAQAFADRVSKLIGIPVLAARSACEAVEDAEIICTVTAARDPILEGRWLKAGAHVNAVGSSFAPPAELDNELVRCSRFIADCREGVISQGAEFLRAKAAGLVGDAHIVGEIGEVFAGSVEGRRSPEEITVYKSLGHIVQDLAAASLLIRKIENKRCEGDLAVGDAANEYCEAGRRG